MSNSYKYICSSCSKEFDSKFIESNMVYICPDCGTSKKNQPLTGVLKIAYDYSELKSIYNKQFFENVTPGKFWLYPKLWPLDFSLIDKKQLDLISLPANQLYQYNFEGRSLYLQDETHNPTFSYKDRASILVALKAAELGINKIAAASTGNAGSSIAGICSRLGLKANIFVPKNIPEAKRIQIQAYGADLNMVDGDYDEAFDLCLEISEANNWYNRNTAYNPLTIEGKKSAAFDIYINSKGDIPLNIFVPVGDGVIIAGLYKGFVELKKLGLINRLPKLIAVQAEGSSAVVDYLSSGKFEYKPATTLADSISAGAPRNLYLAVKAVSESGGFGLKVTDDEILKAQKTLAEKYGMLVEPSCAASYAGFIKIKHNIPSSESVLLLLTGSGLKDFSSLKLWNQNVEAKTSDQLREELKIGDR